MKFSIVLLFICSANAIDPATIGEQIQLVMGYVMECAKEAKLGGSGLEQLKGNEPNQAGKCTILCVGKKLQVMNDDGSLTEDPQHDMITKLKTEDPKLFETLTKLHATCRDKVQIGKDACENAFKLVGCFKQEAKQYNLHQFFV